MLNVGDKAPDLLGVDESGKEIRVSDYAGRKLVVYFYPKDSTPGCTAEACGDPPGRTPAADPSHSYGHPLADGG